MAPTTYLAVLAIFGSALALPYPGLHKSERSIDPTFPTDMGCGEVNVFYT